VSSTKLKMNSSTSKEHHYQRPQSCHVLKSKNNVALFLSLLFFGISYMSSSSSSSFPSKVYVDAMDIYNDINNIMKNIPSNENKDGKPKHLRQLFFGSHQTTTTAPAYPTQVVPVPVLPQDAFMDDHDYMNMMLSDPQTQTNSDTTSATTNTATPNSSTNTNTDSHSHDTPDTNDATSNGCCASDNNIHECDMNSEFCNRNKQICQNGCKGFWLTAVSVEQDGSGSGSGTTQTNDSDSHTTTSTSTATSTSMEEDHQNQDSFTPPYEEPTSIDHNACCTRPFTHENGCSQDSYCNESEQNCLNCNGNWEILTTDTDHTDTDHPTPSPTVKVITPPPTGFFRWNENGNGEDVDACCTWKNSNNECSTDEFCNKSEDNCNICEEYRIDYYSYNDENNENTNSTMVSDGDDENNENNNNKDNNTLISATSSPTTSPTTSSSSSYDNNDTTTNYPTISPNHYATTTTNSPTLEIPLSEKAKQMAKEEEEEINYIIHDPTAQVMAILLAFFGIFGMLFTAYSILERPDGLCANVCRLSLKGTEVFLKIICFPFRVCGLKYRGYTGSKWNDAQDKAVFIQAEDYIHDLEMS